MTTGQPLYLRIRDRIRAEILYEQGLGPDGRLPTERELQMRFGVSRPTIAKALAALASEGELLVAHGRGRFIHGLDRIERQLPKRARIGYVASIATETLTQRALCGIERAARQAGYGVVMASANDSYMQEKEAVRDLVASGAVGIIIYPVPRPIGMPEPDYLSSSSIGVPLVLLDTGLPEHGHTQFIFDNERVCYGLTAWLIEHGHKRIAYVLGDQGILHGPLIARLRGYRRALAAHGLAEIPDLIVHHRPRDSRAIADVAARFAAMQQRPTALIATDDMAAMEFIESFSRLGLHSPEDIHVVGFDDREEARRLKHQFSTTRPDFERLGECAAEELIALIGGEALPNRTYVHAVPLVIRRHGSSRGAEYVHDPSAMAVVT